MGLSGRILKTTHTLTKNVPVTVLDLQATSGMIRTLGHTWTSVSSLLTVIVDGVTVLNNDPSHSFGIGIISGGTSIESTRRLLNLPFNESIKIIVKQTTSDTPSTGHVVDIDYVINV